MEWIWRKQNKKDPQMEVFQKKANINAIYDDWNISIAADSRYRLYINGKRILDGPCKGTREKRYFDTINIMPFLSVGRNVMTIFVAHYSPSVLLSNAFMAGPTSVVSSEQGVLSVSDSYSVWDTNDTWSCMPFIGYEFSHIISQLSFMEKYDSNRLPEGTFEYDFNPNNWEKPKIFEDFYTGTEYGQKFCEWELQSRSIPLMIESEERFNRIMRCKSNQVLQWNDLLTKKEITIPANTVTWVEVEASSYATAFPYLSVLGGKGTFFAFIYSECYYQKCKDGTIRKGIRDDCNKRAIIAGYKDVFVADGNENTYIPFYYRAFRYIRLEIRTGNEPVKITRFAYIRSKYPLLCKATFETEAKQYGDLWAISINTLNACMYETYIDCPYYEQLQYTLDTVLQMQYTYSISDDDRLARKAIDDFYISQLPSGLIPANAPARVNQIITGFPLFWIFMLENHYIRFEDSFFIKKYLQGADKVIDYFKSHINNYGFVCNTENWNFVDWVDGWKMGVPIKHSNGGNVIYTLMLSATVKSLSFLYEKCCLYSKSKELKEFAEKLSQNVLRYAFDTEEGLFYNEYPFDVNDKKSQHAQIWAVLSDTVKGEDANKLMNKILSHNNLSEVSYCMTYFLLRAADKAGCYQMTQGIWEKFFRLLPLNLQTVPEDDLIQRSDCHGWGAVALYDFIHCGLGIGLDECGVVIIQPKMLWLGHCKGKAPTKSGMISVEWNYKKEIFTLSASCDKMVDFIIIQPNGHTRKYKNTKYVLI